MGNKLESLVGSINKIESRCKSLTVKSRNGKIYDLFSSCGIGWVGTERGDGRTYMLSVEDIENPAFCEIISQETF